MGKAEYCRECNGYGFALCGACGRGDPVQRGFCWGVIVGILLMALAIVIGMVVHP